MRWILLDTTILSNFAHARKSELLQHFLGEEAAITPTVLLEIQQGISEGWVPVCDWSWLTVLELSQEEIQEADGFMYLLDRGEAECIAITQR